MPSHHSNHSSAKTMERSLRHERDIMFEALRGEAKYGKRVLVAIVRPECVEGLEKKLPLPNKWKFWKEKPHVLVTTEDWLNEDLNDLNYKPSHQELILLVSPKINWLHLDASSEFEQLKTLKIFHCGNPHSQLNIGGSSTFNNIRFDDVHVAKKYMKYEVVIGPGVCVTPQLKTNIDESVKTEIREHLQEIEGKDMDKGGEESMRKMIALLMGATTTVGKLSAAFFMNASAKGAYVYLQHGSTILHVGGGAANFSVGGLVAGAGPAILLGAGVACAVYFIPWDSVLDCIKSMFSQFWDWICNLWARFQSWVNDKKGGKSCSPSVPMRFSS